MIGSKKSKFKKPSKKQKAMKIQRIKRSSKTKTYSKLINELILDEDLRIIHEERGDNIDNSSIQKVYNKKI